MTFVNLFIGFSVNLLIALVIVRGIYWSVRQGKDSTFTFIAFNTVIYFVMAFLANSQLSVGVGFGLFAIFSLLRYRTSAVSTREMTYLFILIALPVMNSVLMTSGSWLTLIAANSTVVVVLYVLERGWGFHYENSQFIKYDRIEFVKPENHRLLLEDLRQRTGLLVTGFEFGRINFVEDTVDIIVYFDDPKMQLQQTTYRASYTSESYLPLETN
jgi:hypothetical protein